MRFAETFRRLFEPKKEYLSAMNEVNQTLLKIYEHSRGMNQEINWIRNDLHKFISSNNDSSARTAEQLRDINKELSDLNHKISMASIPLADIPNKIFDIRTIAAEINSKTKGHN